jgi:hypothetical protein
MKSARLRYYNPKLDPRTQAEKMTPEMREAVNADTYGWDTEKAGGPLNVPDADHPYNLVSSLCADGGHRIALDIDVPIMVTPSDGGLLVEWVGPDGTTEGCNLWVTGGEIVESSTPGHCHLYGDNPMSWTSYTRLLLIGAELGLLEDGYAKASIARGQSLLRPPHVRKNSLVSAA